MIWDQLPSRKANVVADALSRKSYVNMLVVRRVEDSLCREFQKLNLVWVANTEAAMELQSQLGEDIRKGQLQDEKLQKVRQNIPLGQACCATKGGFVCPTSRNSGD